MISPYGIPLGRFCSSFCPMGLYRSFSMYLPKTIDQLRDDGAETSVNGWIRSMRSQKNFTFIDLVDGTNNRPLQVVLESKLADG